MANMRTVSKLTFRLLFVVAVSLWTYIFSLPGVGGLQVAFLSIGQGDATYIQAPNGRQMIIDGGPRGALMKPLREQMPPGDTSIDVIVMTNPDTDHYAGFIELLEQYSIGVVIEPGVVSKTKTYQEFEKLVEEKKIRKVIARKGVVVTLDQAGGVTYRVIFPDRNPAGLSNNDASVVGRLSYGATSIMLTGDATTKTESFIIAANPVDDLKSDILKVGHHGSRTSTSEAFLKKVAPTIAIISAGKNNRYGHPHKEIIERLARFDIETLVTKDKGTLLFTSDGHHFQKQIKSTGDSR